MPSSGCRRRWRPRRQGRERAIGWWHGGAVVSRRTFRGGGVRPSVVPNAPYQIDREVSQVSRRPALTRRRSRGAISGGGGAGGGGGGTGVGGGGCVEGAWGRRRRRPRGYTCPETPGREAESAHPPTGPPTRCPGRARVHSTGKHTGCAQRAAHQVGDTGCRPGWDPARTRVGPDAPNTFGPRAEHASSTYSVRSSRLIPWDYPEVSGLLGLCGSGYGRGSAVSGIKVRRPEVWGGSGRFGGGGARAVPWACG